MTTRIAAFLVISSFAAPIRAELSDDVDALRSAWSANAHVTVLPPHFGIAGEPLLIALPQWAIDTRRDGCTTVGVMGAVSTTFAVVIGEDETQSPADSYLPSVAGAAHIVRCGDERARLGLLGIQLRSPHGVLETIVATSSRPLVELRTVLGHRDPGTIPVPAPPSPPPAPAPTESRAEAIERTFSRDGATEVVPRLAPTDGAGSGQILLDFAPGCHRFAILSTVPPTPSGAPDVDAEIAWANGQVAAQDRTDSPDAALVACTGERRLGVLAYRGGPARTPVIVLEGRSPLPDGLPASVGPDALGRFAKVLAEYHVALPGNQPIYSSLGVAGITELPVETEPGQCYVAMVSPIQGEAKLLSLRAEAGSLASATHTDESDSAVLLSFCARAAERARLDVEAHGKELVWIAVLWPVARLRLGEEAP